MTTAERIESIKHEILDFEMLDEIIEVYFDTYILEVKRSDIASDVEYLDYEILAKVIFEKYR